MIELGKIVATPGALEAFTMPELLEYLERHRTGDWGELDEHDVEANRQAVIHGSRVLSSYPIRDRKLWIITEADRSVTTFLLPEEY